MKVYWYPFRPWRVQIVRYAHEHALRLGPLWIAWPTTQGD